VLGAFAGAASAQSSVTLFGIVDVNARYVDNNGVKQYQLSQDGINSSRLGFRGSEDLGGGMAASFWLEGSLNPDTGTATGQTWTRRSTVSLSGGWGEMRLGRDYTATFWNWTIFDPFGTNGVGASSNLGLGGAVQSVPTGGSYATAVRANNIIAYFLPSGIAGGLYGQVQVAAGENAFGNKYFGGRLGYAAGPFDVAGAFGRTQLTNDLDATNYNCGGSWDFKFMKLMGRRTRTTGTSARRPRSACGRSRRPTARSIAAAVRSTTRRRARSRWGRCTTCPSARPCTARGPASTTRAALRSPSRRSSTTQPTARPRT
jgi:predicted porin